MKCSSCSENQLRKNERGTERIRVRFKAALSPRDDKGVLYSVTEEGWGLNPLPLTSEALGNPSPSSPKQACSVDSNERLTLKSPHHSGRSSFPWMGLLGSLLRVRTADVLAPGPWGEKKQSWHLLQHAPCQIDSNWLGYEHMIKGAARFIYQERLKSGICAA